MTARTQQLYAKARAGLAQGDAGYWQAAEAMVELYEAGETQMEIAAGVGCNQVTVSRYLRVWEYARGHNPKPSFSEAMTVVRDRSDVKTIPKTPERRAELAAELLKDKAVYEQPAVRKQVERHTERELRQAAATFNREHDIPTRTEKTRDSRRQSPASNAIFWRDVLYEFNKAASVLNDAVGELDRTGLPNNLSGDILRAARTLGKKAEAFADAAAKRAIGVYDVG